MGRSEDTRHDTPLDDIIQLPHHVSQKHPPMAMIDRAAQFSPFAALTGLDATLRETARRTDQRIILDEYEQAALDDTLQAVRDALAKKQHPAVEICYFVPDDRKAGGAYRTAAGTVKKMSEFERLLFLEDGTAVPIQEILTIGFLG